MTIRYKTQLNSTSPPKHYPSKNRMDRMPLSNGENELAGCSTMTIALPHERLG